MSSSTPNKGLGCHQAVDGNMLTEYTHQIKQCRQVSSRARSARLTFYEAKSMLESRIIPQVTYSMSLTTFTALQCKNMNIIIDRTMLNKMGINRNMPRAVVYSSLQWGGMNYPNFQIIQDQKGILYLIQQLRWQGTIANDLLTVLSAVQLVSGLCRPLLEDTTTNLHYMNQGWFTHIRRRLAKMNGNIWIEHQWCPQLQ